MKFFWIPSHTGISGNDRADLLAKNATNCLYPKINCLPFTDLFENFKNLAILNTRTEIKKYSELKGKNYFTLYYSEQKHPWYSKLGLPRKIIVSVNRIRANHYNLRASLARINLVEDSMCECEEAEQDINHIIWQCKIFDRQRNKLLQQLKKKNFHLPLNIDSIICNPDKFILTSLYDFFESCNLKI